jgi:hypothetical protein
MLTQKYIHTSSKHQGLNLYDKQNLLSTFLLRWLSHSVPDWGLNTDTSRSWTKYENHDWLSGHTYMFTMSKE